MDPTRIVLAICDRFRIDPDRARMLNAEVLGVMELDQEMRAAARG